MSPSKLQKFLDKRNLSMTEWSVLTHVSVRTVERYLNGETESPHPLVLESFAREMNIILEAETKAAARA